MLESAILLCFSFLLTSNFSEKKQRKTLENTAFCNILKGFNLVEAGRVELPSENPSMGTSPGADGYCGSLALPVPLSPGKPSRLGVR